MITAFARSYASVLGRLKPYLLLRYGQTGYRRESHSASTSRQQQGRDALDMRVARGIAER